MRMEGGTELAPWNMMIFRYGGGVGGTPGSSWAFELLSGIQSLLIHRTMKQPKLGIRHSNPVISFKRICRLGEHWRLCWQEVEVGGILGLLMLLWMSCLMFTNFCQSMHDDILWSQQLLKVSVERVEAQVDGMPHNDRSRIQGHHHTRPCLSELAPSATR
jgi:hypothetical protein